MKKNNRKFKKWRKLFVGFFLASATDMAMGIIYAWIWLRIFSWPGNFFIYFFAVIASILPDIDAVICRKKEHDEGEFYSEHRSWPHWPMMMIPLSVFGVFLFLSFESFWVNYFLADTLEVILFFSSLTIVCELSHYIRDSLNFKENGTGIQWVAPFVSYDYFLLNFHIVFHFFIKRTETKKEGLIKIIKEEAARRLHARKEKIDDWLEKYYPEQSISSFYGLIFLGFVVMLATSI